ncbi:hypothetical protein [Oceanibacterium hippocampi]|uniref:Type II secretion system protein D n=1 Tax=Oceanibacterium hippocampi TaxID=745714 RepID=A0A1Y5SJK8_9PROT|nr:hypothetical protein [Oceanibacterium hippocampi]SLN39166.1 Type II secretion system protein D precursor [Oceanibacterium hippocampi]
MRLTSLLSCVAILAALMLAAPHGGRAQEAGNDGDRGGDAGSGGDTARLRELLLRLPGQTQVRIETVLLTSSRDEIREFGVDFGIVRENENRINLGFLAGLTRAGWSADDFTDETRVGDVLIEPPTILVSVTPQVATADLDLVILNADYSYRFAAPPRVATREVVTRLMPENGATILGGLVADGTTKSASGVPMLSDVPGLAALFRGEAHRTRRNELILLIKPTIILNNEE